MTKHISMDHNFDDSENCMRVKSNPGWSIPTIGQRPFRKKLKLLNDVHSNHDVQSNSVITNSSARAIFA